MSKTIITIGRQFGAGGRELGKKLADKLNITYYDKEVIDSIAALSGLSREFIMEGLKGIHKKIIINKTYRCHVLCDIFNMIERKRHENRQIDWNFVHITAKRHSNSTLLSGTV